MEEQSHKHEMSAAVRADFERLRARGVVSTIAREDPSEREPVPPPAALPERWRRRWLRRRDDSA